MKRTLVIGSGGTGKTTVARRLAQRTGLPLIHLDLLYWRPGWQPTPGEEWHETVRRLVAGESWIIDGNYGGAAGPPPPALRPPRFPPRPPLPLPWRLVSRPLAVFRRGGPRA